MQENYIDGKNAAANDSQLTPEELELVNKILDKKENESIRILSDKDRQRLASEAEQAEIEEAKRSGEVPPDLE
ncbi:MAG: hypothetical protein WAW92_02715 [Minisyncoccia bacterium]